MIRQTPSWFSTGSTLRAVLMWISGVVYFFTILTAYAQEDAGARTPPSETVSVVYVIVFAVLFLGMIVGFFWYLWMNERKRKSESDETNGTPRGAG